MSEKRSAQAPAEPEVTEKKAKLSPEEEGDHLAEEEDIEEEEEEEDGEEDDGEAEVRTVYDDFGNYKHSFNRTRRRREKMRMTVRMTVRKTKMKEREKMARKERKKKKLRIDYYLPPTLRCPFPLSNQFP